MRGEAHILHLLGIMDYQSDYQFL